MVNANEPLLGVEFKYNPLTRTCVAELDCEHARRLGRHLQLMWPCARGQPLAAPTLALFEVPWLIASVGPGRGLRIGNYVG